MKTFSAKAADIEKKWVLIDATGLVPGRLASIVALRSDGADELLAHVTATYSVPPRKA
jgi:ribosomal protein L13